MATQRKRSESAQASQSEIKKSESIGSLSEGTDPKGKQQVQQQQQQQQYHKT